MFPAVSLYSPTSFGVLIRKQLVNVTCWLCYSLLSGVPPSYGMPWITSTGNNHAGLPNIRMKCLSCTVVLYDALWACGESDAECSRSIELCVLSMACSVECIRFKVLCGFSWIRACSVQLVNLFIFTSHRSFYPSTSSILCVRADSSF